MGTRQGNNFPCLGIADQVREAVTVFGQDFDDLLEKEENLGLGNGGLGRLADCYTDSLVSVNVPTIRYCMLHQFSISDQEIRDGWQIPGPVNLPITTRNAGFSCRT